MAKKKFHFVYGVTCSVHVGTGRMLGSAHIASYGPVLTHPLRLYHPVLFLFVFPAGWTFPS